MSADIWTNSRLKAYQTCPMKEKFRYRDCLVPLSKGMALNIGSAVHKGIETWSVEQALESMEFDYPTCTEDANAQDIARGTVQAMLNGYFSCYAPFGEHQPEFEFLFNARYPTKRGFRKHKKVFLAGKIDDIAVIDGETWLVEYKTASRIDKSYFDRLYLDSQITFYMLAAMRHGIKPVGVLYRVLRKPQIKQRQNETVEAYIERLSADYLARPDFYFFETKLRRSDSDIERFETDLWNETRHANRLAEAGQVFRHSQACSDYGTCPYFPLCTGEAGAEAMYERREPHEELEHLKGE